mmetsp:Transcript_45809/g.89540  ORF Transcript_45809/g.89540 Transcript_45809/m.89540 type:complete len:81 (+) Transcript_45809:37-279(+)
MSKYLGNYKEVASSCAPHPPHRLLDTQILTERGSQPMDNALLCAPASGRLAASVPVRGGAFRHQAQQQHGDMGLCGGGAF